MGNWRNRLGHLTSQAMSEVPLSLIQGFLLTLEQRATKFLISRVNCSLNCFLCLNHIIVRLIRLCWILSYRPHPAVFKQAFVQPWLRLGQTSYPLVHAGARCRIRLAYSVDLFDLAILGLPFGLVKSFTCWLRAVRCGCFDNPIIPYIDQNASTNPPFFELCSKSFAGKGLGRARPAVNAVSCYCVRV